MAKYATLPRPAPDSRFNICLPGGLFRGALLTFASHAASVEPVGKLFVGDRFRRRMVKMGWQFYLWRSHPRNTTWRVVSKVLTALATEAGCRSNRTVEGAFASWPRRCYFGFLVQPARPRSACRDSLHHNECIENNQRSERPRCSGEYPGPFFHVPLIIAHRTGDAKPYNNI